jgi:hypothetical protein
MFYWDPVPYRSRNSVFCGGDAPSFIDLHLLPP